MGEHCENGTQPGSVKRTQYPGAATALVGDHLTARGSDGIHGGSTTNSYPRSLILTRTATRWRQHRRPWCSGGRRMALDPRCWIAHLYPRTSLIRRYLDRTSRGSRESDPGSAYGSHCGALLVFEPAIAKCGAAQLSVQRSAAKQNSNIVILFQIPMGHGISVRHSAHTDCPA